MPATVFHAIDRNLARRDDLTRLRDLASDLGDVDIVAVVTRALRGDRKARLLCDDLLATLAG